MPLRGRSLIFNEMLEVKYVFVDKALLHIVKFVCAHRVEITSLQLLLQQRRVRELIEIEFDAAQVVLHDQVILFIGAQIGLALFLEPFHFLLLLPEFVLVELEVFLVVNAAHI